MGKTRLCLSNVLLLEVAGMYQQMIYFVFSIGDDKQPSLVVKFFDVQVYEWMNNRGERFRISTSDTAIQLDLVAKVHGVSSAEDYFQKLPDALKDKRVYGALLNAYVRAKSREMAESLISVMREREVTPAMHFHSMLDDIQGAEDIYEEWLSVKSAYDPRIGNLLIGWYVRKGFLEKAKKAGHIRERRISEAVSCLNEAALAEGSNFWKPKPVNVSSILKFCQQEDDMASKEVLLGVLTQKGCFEDKVYMSYIPISNGMITVNELPMEKGSTDDDDDGAEMILNQLQGSL
ncbi:hypothetical protein RJ639_006013 [Escallonia herrerae]|uniref:Pentatricopeptide repeat-containing protein n=1 Tax=Escallonia herrerae TaxID=1293975 RepID=A0AA88VTT3_9ASTE|nr:hypothetical protein RJ639_006013 [Escallonia herrerae]